MLNYDLFADQYNKMVKHGYQRRVHQYIIETDLSQKSICELGCGQGSLANDLNTLGSKVIAVDSSKKQLEYARALTDEVDWLQGDAMALPDTFNDESFDIVISSLMLMDVHDHNALFKESYRILKPGGIMIWMVMHPCFQSPFSFPLEDGSRNVSDYTPQFWKSKGRNTLRSVLGSYQRPVSQYVNDFMKGGFALDRIFEPYFDKKISDHLGALGRKNEGRQWIKQ